MYKNNLEFRAIGGFISLALGYGKAYLILARACSTSWTFHHTGIISQISMSFATPCSVLNKL